MCSDEFSLKHALQVILMYVFPIKPSIGSEIAHVQNNLGCIQIFCSSLYNSMQKLKLQDQFEGNALWNNLSLRGTHAHNKWSVGAQNSQTGLSEKYIHLPHSIHYSGVTRRIPGCGPHRVTPRVRSAGNVTVITRNLPRDLLRQGQIEKLRVIYASITVT